MAIVYPCRFVVLLSSLASHLHQSHRLSDVNGARWTPRSKHVCRSISNVRPSSLTCVCRVCVCMCLCVSLPQIPQIPLCIPSHLCHPILYVSRIFEHLHQFSTVFDVWELCCSSRRPPHTSYHTLVAIPGNQSKNPANFHILGCR